MAVDIDAVFKVIGEFGPYQKRVYFLLCLPVLFTASSSLSFVFLSAVPKYRCLVPICDFNVSNPTYNGDFVNFTIPVDLVTGTLSQCQRYQRVDNQTTCMPEDYSPTQTMECPEGKVFDKTVYESTVVSEFNLTCQEAWQGESCQSIYFGGVLLGSMLFGLISDRFGRKVTLIVNIVLMAVSGITVALASSLRSFNVMRFANAAVTAGVFQTLFILGMECVGPSKRVMCGIVLEYFFAMGEVMLGLVAMWVREWRMLQLLISAPVSCFMFYWWFIPESPRWLQARGKHQQVATVLEKFAQKNKKTIPTDLLRLGSSDASATTTVSAVRPLTLKDVIKSPLLCLRMLSMFFIWIVTTLVYYGLSQQSSELGTSEDATLRPYVNFILAALVELPGYTLAWAGMTLWGRRGSLAFSLVLAGLSCIAAGFTAEYSEDMVLVSALLGKCFITCAFGIIYVFAAEIFPTSIRSTVLGLCSMWARVGGMLAPFSSELATIYKPLPLIMFGGCSLVAGTLIMVMPETLGTNLPDTIEDALYLGRENSSNREERLHLLGESVEDLYGTEDFLPSHNGDNATSHHHQLSPHPPDTQSEA